MAGDRDHDPSEDAVQPEFRDDAGAGDPGAEETAPEGLGVGSGTGSAHDYPGRAPADDDGAEAPQDAGDAEQGPRGDPAERD